MEQKYIVGDIVMYKNRIHTIIDILASNGYELSYVRDINISNMKKISTERLAELLKAEYKLGLLEAGGVDNWDGYDVSLSCEYDDETESYFDFKKKSGEEITSEFEDVE